MNIIDIHAHYVAPELITLVEREGARHHVTVSLTGDGKRQFRVGEGQSPALPHAITSLERRFDQVQEKQITMQMLLPQIDLSGYHLIADDGLWFSSIQNETLAETVHQYPERFAALATVPLQAPEIAAREAIRAVRDLHMCGVEVGTHVNGLSLDQPIFDVFWATIQELDIPVFLHPLAAPGQERLQRYSLTNLIGYPAETTAAAAQLIFGGVLDRFPRLLVCLAHAGGFLPYQIGRLDRGYQARPELQTVDIKQHPSSYLRRFYFDSITHSQAALEYLCRMVGPERIMLGTDYPFEIGDPEAVERVRSIKVVSLEEQDKILGGNAMALFRLEH
jgi:aminocarboxymuconate-semialdehyde decarboxylase